MRADPDAGHVSGAARMKFIFTILRCLFRKFSTWKLCSQAQSAAGPGCPWASPIPLGARFASLCSGWMPALAHFEPAWSGARSYEAPPPNAWPPQAPFTLEPGPWAQGCVSLRRQRCGFGVRGAGGWAVVTLPSSPRHRLPGLGPQEDAAGGLRGAAQHGAEARPAAAARLRPHPRRSAGGWGVGVGEGLTCPGRLAGPSLPKFTGMPHALAVSERLLKSKCYFPGAPQPCRAPAGASWRWLGAFCRRGHLDGTWKRRR